jgi:hypothetical protein
VSNAVNDLLLAIFVYEERSIIARPHKSFDDQQICGRLVQILNNQHFVSGHFSETIDTPDTVDNEYEGTEQTNQPPDSEDVPVTRSSSNDKLSSD